MEKQSTVECLRNALLRRITKSFQESDWIGLGLEVGMVEKIQKHPRLFRGLTWGNEDYASHAVDIGSKALNKLGLTSSGGLRSNDGVSPDVLARVEKVFRTSAWLREEEPELYNNLYQAQGAVDATASLENVAQRMGIKDVDAHTRRIREGLINDPQQAIGQAKDLLETVCKEILGLHGNDKATRTKDLPALFKEVRTKLQLEVAGLPGDDQRLKIFTALTQISTSASEIRNLGLGTGHGVARGPKADAILAEFVVTAVSGLCHFLLATFEDGSGKTARRIYEL